MKSTFRTLVLTRRCTHFCEFCPIVQYKYDQLQRRTQRLVSTSQEFQQKSAEKKCLIFQMDAVLPFEEALQEAIDFLDETLPEAKVGRTPVLWLSGGEPLLYPRLSELLEKLTTYIQTEYESEALLGICTNGFLSTTQYAEKIGSNWPQLIHTSLHGYFERHDIITHQDGSCRRTLDFLDFLATLEDPKLIVIQSCLTSLNKNDAEFFHMLFDAIIRLLRAKKAVMLQLTYPCGQVATSDVRNLETTMEYLTFYELQSTLDTFFEVLMSRKDELENAYWYNSTSQLKRETPEYILTDFQVLFQGFPRCVLPSYARSYQMVSTSAASPANRLLLEEASESGNTYKINGEVIKHRKSADFGEFLSFCPKCPYLEYCNGFSPEASKLMLTEEELSEILASDCRSANLY